MHPRHVFGDVQKRIASFLSILPIFISVSHPHRVYLPCFYPGRSRFPIVILSSFRYNIIAG